MARARPGRYAHRPRRRVIIALPISDSVQVHQPQSKRETAGLLFGHRCRTE